MRRPYAADPQAVVVLSRITNTGIAAPTRLAPTIAPHGQERLRKASASPMTPPTGAQEKIEPVIEVRSAQPSLGLATRRKMTTPAMNPSRAPVTNPKAAFTWTA